MNTNNILVPAAWITSSGPLGIVMFCCAQADAAQEKLAHEWALSGRETRRQRTWVLEQPLRR